ncbi:right-handed parallel beta-helix repeat-containing protein, partial [Candidatus Marithioploca araucensis]|nr:right-handed parallel beta-helix repeat-containing protein [Candidatus Marithioploca araucensis]
LQASTGLDVKNSIAEKNKIPNTALFRGYGRMDRGVYQGVGIAVFGKAYIVRQNIIERSSHAGIKLKEDGYHLIENNIIRQSLLILNDGGAIVIGADGNIIKGNLLSESVGNIDESNGCASLGNTPCSKHDAYGMGIGANPEFRDNVIEGNTVFNNSDQGIRLNSFINTVVRNNVVYNNANQIVIEDKKGPSYDNVIENNLVYSLTPDQRGIQIIDTTGVEHATFDNNTYCNPYSEVVFEKNMQRYSLSHWQNDFSPNDANSKWCKANFEEYAVSNVNTGLIINSTFDTDISEWNRSGSVTVSHDPSKAEMDGGSLKAVYGGTNNANVLPNLFDLVENQRYRLKFSVIGNGFGTIKMRINKTEP